MRPIRLEIEGFTSFREPTVVDFEGVDYFALVGPTGAGKSSVIDAITFALYGCVPRFDDNRMIGPAVSAGRLELKVRLDFSLGDTVYTVVRVVRMKPDGGANQKEIRLQQGDEVVVHGDVRKVNAAIQDLLGLDFAQFTKCVVLPQGDFAKFLHDNPKDRQQLLVRLLDLGLYSDMARRANTRAAEAKATADAIEGEALRAGDVGPEAVAAAAERVRRLEAVATEIDAATPALDALREQAKELDREAKVQRERAAQLAALRVPAEVTDLAAGVVAAQEALAGVEEEAAAAESAVAAADERVAALGDPAPLLELRRWHDERATRSDVVARATAAVTATDAAAQVAAMARADAEVRATEAHDALKALELHHRAVEVADALAVGEPCPVCLQTVDVLPTHAVPKDLAKAKKAAAAATKELETAARAAESATTAAAVAANTADDARRRLAEADAALDGADDLDAVVAALAAIDAARAEADAARRADQEVRRRVAAARRSVDEAAAAAAGARAAFDKARDPLAALGAPVPARVDLAADWEQLVTWAGTEAPALEKAAAELAGKRADVVAEGQTTRARLTELLRAEAVKVGVNDALDRAAITAVSEARAEVARLEERVAAIRAAAERVAELRDVERVAKSLGMHLSARGFEKWLLDEALHQLVAQATELLRQLSQQRYSLTMADDAFAVIDHFDGDQVRPAKTLSGGETFLASLSLALALADRLGELASQGAAPLEAMFLDEGFGTLDPDTLDTVAAAIETLGASGRMVGIVTHVRDLAERVPVRFEVDRGPGTSTVTRVET